MPDKRKQAPPEDEERLAIPLDPVEALRALLRVDPESEPTRAAREELGGKDRGANRRHPRLGRGG
jgi:hypothetical protein